MTTLGVIGDVHMELSVLDVVLAWLAARPLDGVLLVGDLANGGHVRRPRPVEDWRWDAHQVIARVAQLGVPVLAVPGNHDLPALEHPGDVDGRVGVIGALRVGGLGGAGPARFGFPYEWSEADAAARLGQLPEVDVLLSHTPPWHRRDRTRRGAHVGSKSVLHWAATHAGFLACGHIHEDGGCDREGDCLVLNAGGLGQPFGLAQVGLIEREPGVDRVSWRCLDDGRAMEHERRTG